MKHAIVALTLAAPLLLAACVEPMPPVDPGPDACGASQLQYLVGKPGVLLDGMRFSQEVRVIEVPGHPVGHTAFRVPKAGAVFTADSLMALGCGRLFEGTAAQMWASLAKLAALPPETRVCSGHEYTVSNGRFALTIEPANAALISRVAAVADLRAQGRPTVPSTLAEELATNPFLRAGLPAVKALVGLPGAADAEVFAEIRRRKDRF